MEPQAQDGTSPNSTASDSDSEEEDIPTTICVVCRRLLNNPKLLPCGHLVCRRCVVTWLLAETEPVCPHSNCDCAIVALKEGEDLTGKRAEEVADGLPTDLAMEVLVAAERLLTEEHLCCVCNAGDEDGDVPSHFYLDRKTSLKNKGPVVPTHDSKGASTRSSAESSKPSKQLGPPLTAAKRDSPAVTQLPEKRQANKPESPWQDSPWQLREPDARPSTETPEKHGQLPKSPTSPKPPTTPISPKTPTTPINPLTPTTPISPTSTPSAKIPTSPTLIKSPTTPTSPTSKYGTSAATAGGLNAARDSKHTTKAPENAPMPTKTTPPSSPQHVKSIEQGSTLSSKDGKSNGTLVKEVPKSTDALFTNDNTGGRGAGTSDSLPVPAIYYCLDCRDAFCKPCATVHRRQSATRHHAVYDLTTLTVDIVTATASSQPELCQHHEDQAASMFCNTHQSAICLICRANGEHRKCTEVMSLEHRVEQARADLEQAACTLRSANEDIEQNIRKLKKHLSDTRQRVKAAEVEIDKTCDAVISSVNACRSRLKKLVRSSRSDVKAVVGDKITFLEQRQELITSYEEAIERTQSFPGHRCFRPMATTLKERVLDLDLEVTLPADPRFTASVTFATDPKVVIHIQEELSRLGRVGMESDFRFHRNNGKNILLTNNEQTAQKTFIHKNDGIVMSRDPMFTNMLYEVRIDAIQPQYMLTRLGVVTDNPDNFTELPNTFFCPDNDVLCLDNDGAYIFGQKRSEPWAALKDVTAGSRVGLAIDSERKLHLYVNGKDRGVVAADMPHTCYFMVDLFARCTKVTALPVNTI